METTDVFCDCCGQEFNLGETLISLNMNFESFEIENDRGFITVEDSTGLMNFHIGCMKKMNSERSNQLSYELLKVITQNLNQKSSNNN